MSIEIVSEHAEWTRDGMYTVEIKFKHDGEVKRAVSKHTVSEWKGQKIADVAKQRLIKMFK